VTVVFRNRSAGFIWGFAALWLSLLMAMTHVFARDGPPSGYSSVIVVAIMAFFWVGGIGLAAFALSKPCILVTVEPDTRVCATWRYPHKVVRKQFNAASVLPAEVVDAQDDEGNPYFYARVRTVGTAFFDLAEGHTRSLCESACDRFNLALHGRRIPQPPFPQVRGDGGDA
jgi:hypothetical protein